MAEKAKTSHGLRSPMHGFAYTGRTPSVPDLSTSGNVLKGHAPKSAPIESPLNAPAKPNKK